MKMRTVLYLGYSLIFLLIFAGAAASYQSSQTAGETRNLVQKTQKQITKAWEIESLVVEMQTGKRGFTLTGDNEYLKPYTNARDVYESEINNLRELVSDPAQAERLVIVRSLIREWITTIAEPHITLRREHPDGDFAVGEIVREMQREGSGITLINDVKNEIGVFIDKNQSKITEREAAAEKAERRNLLITLVAALIAISVGVLAMLVVSHRIHRQVGGEPSEIEHLANEIAKGNLDLDVDDIGKAKTGILASILAMMTALRENRAQVQRADWLKSGIVRLGDAIRGDSDIRTLASKAISEIATYIDAQVGALYVVEEDNSQVLVLMGSYAYNKRKNLSNEFRIGEGLVGQAALEGQQILLKNVPEDYVKVTSALGERVPGFICVTPFLFEGRIQGVIEIGMLDEMTDQQLEYLTQATGALAVAVITARGRRRLSQAYEESKQLNEELQTQQEELRVSNEELEMQSRRLQESEEELKAQQEELEVTNEELGKKNDLLELQKKEVEKASAAMVEKAEELSLASKYKSEFLANMSHELRTPLNSLLLLAQSLKENKNNNLSNDQIESAEIIYQSGSDLLNLINDILDLSKIEAGRMDLQVGTVLVSDIVDSLLSSFSHMAEQKGLQFEVDTESEVPEYVVSDGKKIKQVLRNLVGNAIKFTETGSVNVKICRPAPGKRPGGQSSEKCIAFAIKDTGIGIAPKEQKIVFEAFQQADGGTSRRFGGTGLGLSISREIAGLLGGEIQLASELGRGSTFTFYLPINSSGKEKKAPPQAANNETYQGTRQNRKPSEDQIKIDDDRNNLGDKDKIILVIEDDPNFARLLLDKCHNKGFKCLAATTGESGLDLAREHLPAAVVLDIRLPGIDGWAVLDELKEDVATRHIPVHIVSAEEATTESFRKGAIGHTTKPIDLETLDDIFTKIEHVYSRKPRTILVVEDADELRRSTVNLIKTRDVRVEEASSGMEAMKALRTGQYDCMILDLGLPDLNGLDLIEKLKIEGRDLPPVIIYTARELTVEEEESLREHAESIIIKDVRSQERLLDEVSLFLHQIVSRMPEKKKRMILDLHDSDAVFKGKKVLIVDDDMRTTFALARLLSDRGIETIKADNGVKALQLLREDPEVDLVLMDIMMPVMDGFETIKKIRAQDVFRRMPIIALTAKAMKEDRDKCLQAGASDYLSKPVDQGRLISMIRVWLYR